MDISIGSTGKSIIGKSIKNNFGTTAESMSETDPIGQNELIDSADNEST